KPTNTTETETGTVSESTVNLSDSDIEQYVLFYSEPADTDSGHQIYRIQGYYNYYDVYYREITSTEITQTITIIQTPKDNYSTTNDAVSGDNVYNSSYTSSSDSTEKTITYTNKRIPYAELNVAVIENGKIIEKNEIRTDNGNIYKHGFNSIPEKWNISDSSVVSPYELINNNSEYVLAGIVSGNADSDTKIVTVADKPVQSLTFGKLSDDSYNLYLNDDASKLLGEKDIYFVYVKRPEIKYVFEKPDGTYVDITPLNKDNSPYERNGTAISQNEIIPLTDANSSQNPMIISKVYSSESVFILPDELDYGNETRMIDLKCMGLGNTGGVTGVSDSTSMLLDISDSGVEYRFRESDSSQLLPENSVIYAIYKIKGYSLTINKSVTGDSGGISDFTFNISSNQLTNSQYYVSGIENAETVSVSDGKISVTVPKDGSVTLYGLKSGVYTVSESDAGDCELFVKVDGQEKPVTGNSFSFRLDYDTSVDVLNKYPIPVTNHKNTSLPYAIIITLLAAAATVMLTIRRKERISRGKSEI
ncbi:MAG: hypothetical protein J6I55_01480, partial [Ruminococcus sp.]|nr:hypothetical protein [Ruminococcus sp.]